MKLYNVNLLRQQRFEKTPENWVEWFKSGEFYHQVGCLKPGCGGQFETTNNQER